MIEAIIEEDLIELFVHSSGKGGQNVNKVATCVYLKHIPTGIEVKCARFRTQGKNRIEARRLLLEKINEAENAKMKAEISHAEKERRKKRRRTAAQKEKMLKNKRIQSEKKLLRKKIDRSSDS